MKVKCSRCGAVYQINASKIPDKGVYTKCTKCQAQFFIKKGDNFQEVPPKRGAEQPEKITGLGEEAKERERAAKEWIGYISKEPVAKKADAPRTPFQEYMAEVNSDHIKAFMGRHRGCILHPEIVKLVKIVETNPNMRTFDKASLEDRLDRIAKMPGEYFHDIGNVHAGRLWSLAGLQMMRKNGIITYMVIAHQWDHETCILCKKFDGMIFEVKQAYNKIMKCIKKSRVQMDVPLYVTCALMSQTRESKWSELLVRVTRGHEQRSDAFRAQEERPQQREVRRSEFCSGKIFRLHQRAMRQSIALQ